MNVSYKDKDGKVIKEKFGGFSVYYAINAGDIKYVSLEGDCTFRCDEIKCPNREDCKNSNISEEKILKKCPYMKNLKKLTSQYGKKIGFLPLNLEDAHYLLFGDTKGLSKDYADNIVVYITHNCENCKKRTDCNELSFSEKNNKNHCCGLAENIFALSALGRGGVPVWDEEHKSCRQVIFGDCAKRFLKEQEKQR